MHSTGKGIRIYREIANDLPKSKYFGILEGDILYNIRAQNNIIDVNMIRFALVVKITPKSIITRNITPYFYNVKCYSDEQLSKYWVGMITVPVDKKHYDIWEDCYWGPFMKLKLYSANNISNNNSKSYFYSINGNTNCTENPIFIKWDGTHMPFRVENCDIEGWLTFTDKAVSKIVKNFRIAISNPNYLLCRNRLKREARDICQNC